MKRGIYRLDMPTDGDPVVRVIRGKAKVEISGEILEVGGKRQLTIAGSPMKLRASKTGRREEDELERWDRERRELSAAQARKRDRDADATLARRKVPPSSDCRACGVAPGRDRKSMPRVRLPAYPLVRVGGGRW